MANTEEQRLDLIENCTVLLEGILEPFDQTDDTPEGRMITQLKWLKERAENHDLPLPVHQDYLSTLRYIYTNGELNCHASSPKSARLEVEVPQQRIIRLAKKGNLLYKPDYQPFIIRAIDALIKVLGFSDRVLTQYERGFIQELYQIKQEFLDGKIIPPIGGHEEYPNLVEVRWEKNDLPNFRLLFDIVNDSIFNGIRPESWLTPEMADQETKPYLQL